MIDRHFSRLQQCLEPSKLLRHLETIGVIDEDDVETIREEKKKTSRENQVAVFVDIIKRRENGLRHLLQALLKSKVQDFLARELLEDDVYDEEEISSILSELENDLDETQSLKLSLIEEQKRHKNTKKELEEIRRSSIVFSDSSSSGLFADYDSAPSDGEEYGDYSTRKEIENTPSLNDDHSASLFDQDQSEFQDPEPQSAAINDDLEWEHEDGWRKFGSLDNLHSLTRRKSEESSSNKLRKSSSMGKLNSDGRERYVSERRRSGHARWCSDESLEGGRKWSSSPHRSKSDDGKMDLLESKVALLEKRLRDEQRKRQISENEVAKLQVEKENLFEELEDTRDQLHIRLSHLNLYCADDDCYEGESYFEQSENVNDFSEVRKVNCEIRSVERPTLAPAGIEETASRSSSPGVDKLRSQSEQMRRTRLTGSWRTVNAQFYELDEYDDEIKVELDPSNIMDTLRRLKTYNNVLYNDVLYERDELKSLKRRASRLESRK